MIDSNNISVMREKLRKMGSSGSGVQEEIERIDNLIGSSPIPGTQRTITGSLNYLYDNIGGAKIKKYVGNGENSNVIEFDETPNVILTIIQDNDGERYNMISFPSLVFGGMAHVSYPFLSPSGDNWQITNPLEITYSGNTMTISGANAPTVLNDNGKNYTVVYI